MKTWNPGVGMARNHQLLAIIITTIIAMYVGHQHGQAFLVASTAMESFPFPLIVLNVLK
jgi:hypothetical protein